MKLPLFSHNKKVIHSGHHKAGSYWIAKIFAEMCSKGLVDMAILEGGLIHMSDYPKARVFYDNNSEILLDVPECVGTHMIRDPRDVIVSGYFYHLWTKESWVHIQHPEWGMTYQEKMNLVSKDEGLMFEMKNMGASTTARMKKWNYSDPRILEVRYEDLIEDPDGVFSKMLRHWGVTDENFEECLEITRAHHMTRETGRKIGEVQLGSHMRNGLPGQWKEHFTPDHKAYFKENFGDILIVLGYEKSNDW